jgi:energy-coupling factor transport system permease protein
MSASRGLHAASPTANAILLVGTVGAVLAWPAVPLALGVLCLAAGLALLSGEPVVGLVPAPRFVLLFALVLFVVQALSIRSGTILVASPVRITSGGLLSGARIALRFLVILVTSALFVRTTNPDRLCDALVRARVPYRYAYVLVLALRFVPFFEDELRAVRDAQKVRDISVSVRTPRRILKAARYTFVPVLVSGLRRVDAIAISMKGRCFGLSDVRTASCEPQASRWSLVAILLALMTVAVAVFARMAGWDA